MLRERKTVVNYTAERELQADLLVGGWKATGRTLHSSGAREYQRGGQHVHFKLCKTQANLDISRKLLRALDAKMTGCDRLGRAVNLLPPPPAPIDSSISKWIGAHDRKKESGQ